MCISSPWEDEEKGKVVGDTLLLLLQSRQNAHSDRMECYCAEKEEEDEDTQESYYMFA